MNMREKLRENHKSFSAVQLLRKITTKNFLTREMRNLSYKNENNIVIFIQEK